MQLTLEIVIDGGQTAAANGRLYIRESYEIPVKSFAEIAATIGRFHDLATEVGEGK